MPGALMFLKRVPHFGKCPWGYRWAYMDYCRLTAVAAPIGLHWIVKWIHRLWELSYAYNKSDLEKLLEESYDAGFKEGRRIQKEQDKFQYLRNSLGGAILEYYGVQEAGRHQQDQLH